jgi:Ca2+-binding EF-hand superfamily protein
MYLNRMLTDTNNEDRMKEAFRLFDKVRKIENKWLAKLNS